MPAGDYSRLYRTYGGSLVDIDLPTAQPILIAPRAANRIITVLYITFTPTVYTGTTLTFIDSLTTNVIGTITVPAQPLTSVGEQMLYIDFGASGTPLSVGASLLLGGSSTGRLHIEAYQKGPLPGPPTYVAPKTAGFTA